MIILKDLYNLISECVFDSGKEAEKDLFYKRTHFLGNTSNIRMNEYDLSNGTVKEVRDSFLNETDEVEGDCFLIKRNRETFSYVIISYNSFTDLEYLKEYTYDNDEYDSLDTYMIFKNKLYFFKKYDYSTGQMKRYYNRTALYEGNIKDKLFTTYKEDDDKSHLNIKVFEERDIFIYYSFFFDKYVIGLNEYDCKIQFIDFLNGESEVFEKLIDEGETDLYSLLLDIDYLKEVLEMSIKE